MQRKRESKTKPKTRIYCPLIGLQFRDGWRERSWILLHDSKNWVLCSAWGGLKGYEPVNKKLEYPGLIDYNLFNPENYYQHHVIKTNAKTFKSILNAIQSEGFIISKE